MDPVLYACVCVSICVCVSALMLLLLCSVARMARKIKIIEKLNL